MVMFYFSPANDYYEGDRSSLLDREVSRRPSADYTWDGSTWQAPTPAAIDARKELAASAAADMAVLRAIVERLFDIENRTRTLEGRSAITAGAYRRALLDRIKELL
jgi:hypothetical protein